jgi:hypothetical protein
MGLIWLFVDFVELLGLVSALFWLLVIYFVIDVAFFCCFEAPYFGRLSKMSEDYGLCDPSYEGTLAYVLNI